MQIYHQDQENNRAVLSIFFDIGDKDSEFLKRIGFDPDGNPKISDMLLNLAENEELYLDNTIIDLKTVRRILYQFIIASWRT